MMMSMTETIPLCGDISDICSALYGSLVNLRDDGMEDGTNGVDNGHKAVANGAKDALDLQEVRRRSRKRIWAETYTRDDSAHFECKYGSWVEWC